MVDTIDNSGHSTLLPLDVGQPEAILRRSNLEIVEEPALWKRKSANFVIDQSGKNISHSLLQEHPHERHGTYRQVFDQTILFGHHHLNAVINNDYQFDCQDIKHYARRLDYHIAHHPGRDLPIPQIYKNGPIYSVDMSKLEKDTSSKIFGSTYHITPTEPLNWGMWLLQALPGAHDFLKNRPADRVMIYTGRDWQKALLKTIGLTDENLVHQELGKSYDCESLNMRQYSHVDIVPTDLDKEIYEKISRDLAGFNTVKPFRRIFLSRKNITTQSGSKYRALVNEHELTLAFSQEGFDIVEPECLTFVDQIRLFRESELVVGLGGAGMFNVVFCQPGTRVISLESSSIFVNNHSMLFGSLNHNYGIVFGKQDDADETPVHKRWSLDVKETLAAVQKM